MVEQGLGEWVVGSRGRGKSGLTRAVDLRVKSYPVPATDLEKVTFPPRTPFLCFQDGDYNPVLAGSL